MWPVALALIAMACVAVFEWGWNIEVIDYGPPSKTYFGVTEAAPGQEILLHFDAAQWLRVCPSRLVQHVTCQQDDPLDASKTITARLDLESHVIDVPQHAGPVPPKARRFVVPRECRPGLLKFTSWAESTCAPFGSFNVRYSYPPELTLQVK